MKKKEICRFVRFGGVNIKKSKGFNTSDSYHSPPSPKGFYAMPFLAQEHFLLGSMSKYQPGVMPKAKGDKYDWTREQWDIFYKKQKRAKSAMRKEFFKNEGTIWHHLVEYTSHHKVLESHGSWVKTDIKDWETAFLKMCVALKAESIKYNRSNPEIHKTIIKKYKENNKEKIENNNRKWRQNNKEYINNYMKNKRKNDSQYHLITLVRCRLNEFLRIRKITKRNNTINIVGCSPEFLKEHIEKQFIKGMSWDLMGKYVHIDHIIPLSSAKTEEEVYKLCHYTNLQPLWAEDNLKKSNKIL